MTTARASPGPASLDDDVIADALSEARDNATFAEPDEWVGLADPDGVAAVPFDAFDPAVAALPAERKIELTLDLERRVRGGDTRITGVRVASFNDSSGRFAVATNTGIAGAGRGAWCSMGVMALAADGDETYTGNGSTVGFSPDDLDLDEGLRRRRAAGHPPLRRPRGPVAAPGRRARAPTGCQRGRPARRHPHRRARAEGSIAVRRPDGRGHRLADAHPGRRPHRPPFVRAPRPTTAKASPVGATCSWPTACSRPSSTTAPAVGGPAGRAPDPRCGASRPPRRSGARRWPSPRVRAPTRSWWRRSISASTCSR